MINLKSDKPIFVVGDVNTDMILPFGKSKKILDSIAKGEINPNTAKPRAKLYAGGSAANTASAIARMGTEVYFCGVSGNDFFADFLSDEFVKDSVNLDYFYKKDGMYTTSVNAVIDQEKERVLYVWPTEKASIHQIFPEDLPDEILLKVGWVHTTGINLREDPSAKTIIEFLKKCQKHNLIISLDLNLRVEEMGLEGSYLNNIKEAVKYSNVIFGSGVEELCPLTGLTDPIEAAKSLVTNKRIIVSRSGVNGINVYTDQEILHSPSYIIDVVDTIGAGDASSAGFISAAIKGENMTNCAKYSNATAAYVLQFEGARSGPNNKELKKLMKNIERRK